MTEQEWQTCTDPTPMLGFLRGKTSERKVRLFAVACCRRIEDLPLFQDYPGREDDGRHAVLVAERYADGAATSEELDRAYWGAELGDGYQPFMTVATSQTDALFNLAYEVFNERVGFEHSRLEKCPPPNEVHLTRKSVDEWNKIQDRERDAQVKLLRDIFGNPYRPVAADPTWLTPTVVALAEGIYEERAFDRMPILADALQDAGCDNKDVLNHCRSDGPHVRGCWVVDIVLGKE